MSSRWSITEENGYFWVRCLVTDTLMLGYQTWDEAVEFIEWKEKQTTFEDRYL